MVKKVKRFLVFVLFSFFYSLLSGKVAEAANARVCLAPKSESVDLKYNGASDAGVTAQDVADDICGY